MRLVIVLLVLFAAIAPAAAQTVTLEPGKAEVYRSGPTVFSITFTASKGQTLTAAGPALFCKKIIVGSGDCVERTILAAYDGASPAEDVPSVTDEVRIDEALAAKARSHAGDFYYVRPFRVGGRLVRAVLPLTLIDPVWLFLDRLTLSAGLPEENGAVELDGTNVAAGTLTAELTYQGEGTIAGWWEVRTPDHPPVLQSERLSDDALTARELAAKKTFQPLRWFHRDLAPAAAPKRIVLQGPALGDLPVGASATFEVLLHFLPTKGVGRSGALSKSSLGILRYRIASKTKFVRDHKVLGLKVPWLQDIPALTTQPKPALSWDLGEESRGETVHLVLYREGRATEEELTFPVAEGRAEIPETWIKGMIGPELTVGLTALDREGLPLLPETLAHIRIPSSYRF